MVDRPMGWSMKAADRVTPVGEVYWLVMVAEVGAAAEGTRMVASTADMLEEEEGEGFQVRR